MTGSTRAGNSHVSPAFAHVYPEENLMTHGLFSLVARHATSSRLESPEAATQAKPLTANARKKKRKKGDVNKLCKQQAEEWRAFFPTVCPEGPICDDLLACTSPALAVCDFTAFLVCTAGGTGGFTESISLP